MKRILSISLLLAVTVLFVGCGATAQKQQQQPQTVQMIRTVTPERAAGQTDVLELATEALPVVRVGFIGLGMRGPGAVYRMMNIPGVEIVALCDVEQDRVKKVNDRLEKEGRPRAKEFYGDTAVWRQLSALPELDLIYIATPWNTHAMMGVQGMKDGKHVAIEVPAAMNMDEIWDLINTSEQTRKHCMQLENCVYDFFELTSLNMAQQGLFGEVLYGEGAYIHNLEPFWKDYWHDWRLEYNINNFGDLYPTHGLGPVAQAMNIHRGDKMNYLTSTQTKTVAIPEFIKRTQGRDVSKDFRNGDHTVTIIKTEKGKVINIQHNVADPRPYDRMFQLTGTKGFANKYPVEGWALTADSFDANAKVDHEKLDGHSFVNKEMFDKLMKEYRHPIVNDQLLETAKKVGGHGGMDFIMDYRMIYCLQNGLPLDMDVYDLAEWCALIPLTGISIENGSAPVEIPDFTRGGWDKLGKLEFATKK
ncbi:Oxidoreductase [Mucinivorans hirudinis]|uniref:Oxidoreductase n=1 Tax=Mucinivorans hirudinis TaxID=1433126 RepID=A0A060RBS9_9BACT|nr:Oxidoreductase [Mucinivorans hirudinis]